MNSSKLPRSNKLRSTEPVEVEIISDDPNSEIAVGGLTENQITQVLTEGAKVVNRILDIAEIRVKTDNKLREIDKEIEQVQEVTKSEIEKMIAETENWERRFQMVSNVLKEMTITITQHKDLDPSVSKAMIDTVKTMVDKLSIK